jgi:hypothetical protein
MLSAFAAVACGRTGSTPGPTGIAARVVVSNRWEADLEVSIEGSGTRYRLGNVAPGLERTFAIPHGLLSAGGRVEFFAVPAGGGRGARSGDLVLTPGDVVDFEITSHLFDSHATIRERSP